MTIQWNNPLTLALSPSDGEREFLRLSDERSPFCDHLRRLAILSLSPSDGERAEMGRGEGVFDCMVTAEPR